MGIKVVRRAQTLGPFGVGGILDIEGESFVAADITRWKGKGEPIREQRLEELLGVTHFKMAPAAPSNPWASSAKGSGIPYFRFPQWLFCSGCRRMMRWNIRMEANGKGTPVCFHCERRPQLTPMRFVMVCPRGHLADVPWQQWAHSETHIKCEASDLRFITRPGGSGLEHVFVKCQTCKSERSLRGIAKPDSLKQLSVRCPGRHPWEEPERATKCDAIPQVLQRGATNLTFWSTPSSIDIPPYSRENFYNNDHIRVTNTTDWQVIKTAPDNEMLVDMLIRKIAGELTMNIAKVEQIIRGELADGDKGGFPAAGKIEKVKSTGELLGQEYQAFLAPDEPETPGDRFLKRQVDFMPYVEDAAVGAFGDTARWLGRHVAVVAQVVRLREVRALLGFSRLAPVDSKEDDLEAPGRFTEYNSAKKIPPVLVPADLDRLPVHSKWLPAIEIFGEGIFLSLAEEPLQKWESAPAVQQRVKILQKRQEKAFKYLPPPSPRMVLLHTLAHILIRQVSFECGYSIASLRERIYSAEPSTGSPMAGILLYTAAGDSEGTLGGLVREGTSSRLFPTIIKALQAAEWCSSDPLCRESQGQGLGAMNLAACHACSLLPETSCTMSNRLLDRGLLLGTPDRSVTGFFSEAMAYLMASLGAETF